MNKEKLIILLDVDGICANYINSALERVEEVTGIKYYHDDVVAMNIPKLLIECEQKRAKCVELLNSPGFAASFTPYDGSADFINYLKEKNHDFFFVTTPMYSNRSWMPERMEWLQSKFGVDPGKVNFVEHKYRFSGDVLIDDVPSVLNAWMKENPRGLGILWNRKYNEKDSGNFIRVSSWDEVRKEIEKYKGNLLFLYGHSSSHFADSISEHSLIFMTHVGLSACPEFCVDSQNSGHDVPSASGCPSGHPSFTRCLQALAQLGVSCGIFGSGFGAYPEEQEINTDININFFMD